MSLNHLANTSMVNLSSVQNISKSDAILFYLEHSWLNLLIVSKYPYQNVLHALQKNDLNSKSHLLLVESHEKFYNFIKIKITMKCVYLTVVYDKHLFIIKNTINGCCFIIKINDKRQIT